MTAVPATADLLTSVLTHFPMRAGVFYTGNICGVHDFARDPVHGHLHLIARGPVELQTDGQRAVTLEHPAVLFFPRPQRHRLVADEGAGADVVCGSILLGTGVDNPVSTSLPDVVQVPLEDMPSAPALLQLMFDEALQDKPGRQSVLDRLCEVFMLQLLRHCMAQGLTSGGLLAGLAEPRLGKAIRAMHEAPALEWDLPRMADTAGMSRARFAHHFHAVVGQPPAHYLRQLRMQAAQALMHKGQTIQQAAQAVGYGSPSAFTRAFAREVGLPPAQWFAAQS